MAAAAAQGNARAGWPAVLRGYLYDTGNGNPLPLELSEVVHFRRFHPLNSFVGLSPIEALAVVATGDMAAQRWNTNFFDKNNAKMPGVLAFRDPIPDPDWERMRRDVKEEYGGTKRSLMMMRGVGDGVQWITTAMSQGDMQFLEGRTFTKEEIFAIYAPACPRCWRSTRPKPTASAASAPSSSTAYGRTWCALPLKDYQRPAAPVRP